MGGSVDPYALYSSRSTLDFPETLFGDMLELFPFLHNLRMLRQWAGIADMTPTDSPVMGVTPVDDFYIDRDGEPGGSRRRRSAVGPWRIASPRAVSPI